MVNIYKTIHVINAMNFVKPVIKVASSDALPAHLNYIITTKQKHAVISVRMDITLIIVHHFNV